MGRDKHPKGRRMRRCRQRAKDAIDHCKRRRAATKGEAMSGRWTPGVDGFGFADGAMGGRVFATPPARSVHVRFQCSAGTGLEQAFDLGRLRFREADGGQRNVRPVPAEAYLQEPQLVVRPLVENAVGLQLALRFHTIANGLEAEIRLQTVETVDEVSQEISFAFRGLRVEFPLEGLTAIRPEGSIAARRSQVALFRDAAGRALVLLVEGGENAEAGFTTGVEGEHRLLYRLFRRPLEKGVILVARMAVCAPEPVLAAAELADFDRAWRRQTPFL
jgi:hypothetical protein